MEAEGSRLREHGPGSPGQACPSALGKDRATAEAAGVKEKHLPASCREGEDPGKTEKPHFLLPFVLLRNHKSLMGKP